MRFLRDICRVVFALTFILSGVLKLIDPVGTGLIVKEYLDFMHLGFLMQFSVAIGIALSALELTIGCCVLTGIKLRFFSSVALGVIGVFTLLTLYLVIANPISDCGCFGEAIHLTNTQTFIKNLVLLLLGLFIFFTRKKATRIARDPLETIIAAFFGLIGICIALHAWATIPGIDFTAYRTGTDLGELADANQARYETTFLYSRDGKVEEFALDNLPDDSWTYVDSRTELVEGDTKMAQIDFQLEESEGQQLAVTIYNPAAITEKQQQRIESFRKRALMAGSEVVVYGPGDEYRSADRKSLMTLNRSNGGAVYFNDGVIVRKWANSQLDKVNPAEILESDPDVLILKSRINEQIYVSILIAGLLLILALVRYFCRMFIK